MYFYISCITTALLASLYCNGSTGRGMKSSSLQHMYFVTQQNTILPLNISMINKISPVVIVLLVA